MGTGLYTEVNSILTTAANVTEFAYLECSNPIETIGEAFLLRI
jgi:hypothetical protein